MQLAQEMSRGERGFAMAALLVALVVMSVAMSVMLPVWRTLSVREREEELIWRGQQYDRAVQLYRKKTSAPGAPSIDVLVKGRFLRQKYLDPVTRGEFEVVGVNPAGINPGGVNPGGVNPGGVNPGGVNQMGNTNAPGVQQPKIGFGQLIGGVRSKSKARSFRELDGKKTYAEWQFVYVPWKPGGQPVLPGTEGPGGLRSPGQPRPGSGFQLGSGTSSPFSSGSGSTKPQEQP